MLHESQRVVSNCSAGIRHPTPQLSGMPQPNPVEGPYNVRRQPHKVPTMGISDFASLDSEYEPCSTHLTSSTIPPVDIPGRRKNEDLATINFQSTYDFTPDLYVKNVNTSLDGDSSQFWWPHNMGPSSTEMERSLQQQQPLTMDPGQIDDLIEGSLKVRNRKCSKDSRSLISQSLDDGIHSGGFGQISHGYPPHSFPGAINIPQARKSYQADQSLSFPPATSQPSTNKWDVPNLHKHRAIISASEPTMIPPNDNNIPMRRKSSRNKSTRTSRSGSLKAIVENGTDGLGSSPTSRGRRHGPLKEATSMAAAQKRLSGEVCIRCKKMKQKVSAEAITSIASLTNAKCKNDLPCEGCEMNANARSWKQPCQRAKFVDLVKLAPCNAVCEYDQFRYLNDTV